MKTADMARMQGFNLIEVLIALVVLSFGMLGLASLQVTGVRGAQSSLYRSQAVALMNDMAERMYVNRSGTNNGDYDGTYTSGICSTAASSCGVESTSSTSSSCNPQAIATFDIVTVACGYRGSDGRKGGVTDQLPSGQIDVTCVGSTGATACPAVGAARQITVSWVERADADSTGLFNQATSSVQMTVQP